MGLYEEYKPFHRYMRRFDLQSSLVDVWHYSLHIMERQLLPASYAVGKSDLTSNPLSELVYPWDIEILARELVINATRMGTRSLKNWDDLATAVNYIRRLEGAAYSDVGVGSTDIMLELHRVAHRQFPWQTDKGVRPMMRALRVFGEKAVEALVVREFGMTMRQFILLGVAVNGSFLKKWGMSTNQDYSVLGVSREASDAFFKRITCTVEQLKAETAGRQSYDRDWLYTWNPLQATPLVSIDPVFPDRVLCPIPRFLNRRVTGGIFYDLVKSVDFDNPFGNSFQNYVGYVIKLNCPPPRFNTLAGQPYDVGTQRMHGVDWILSDNTGHLFIECKAKRLTVGAKTLSDPAALEKDIVVMARAIVQHYRNIRDALDGKTQWVPDGLPVFPLVLTLEDWITFGFHVDELLNKHVRRLLAGACIPELVLEEMPYTIASANEFEILSQVIAQVGICSLMSKKTAPGQLGSLLLPAVSTDFPGEMRRVNWRLFDDDWDKLLPNNPDDQAR